METTEIKEQETTQTEIEKLQEEIKQKDMLIVAHKTMMGQLIAIVDSIMPLIEQSNMKKELIDQVQQLVTISRMLASNSDQYMTGGQNGTE